MRYVKKREHQESLAVCHKAADWGTVLPIKHRGQIKEGLRWNKRREESSSDRLHNQFRSKGKAEIDAPGSYLVSSTTPWFVWLYAAKLGESGEDSFELRRRKQHAKYE